MICAVPSVCIKQLTMVRTIHRHTYETMYIYIYISAYIYSKTSLTDYLHIPLYWLLYLGPIQYHCNDIVIYNIIVMYLPKPTTSLNGQVKSVPWSIDLERFYCIWRALFLNLISAISKVGLAMLIAKFIDCVLEKLFHMYIYLYIHIFIKSFFSKHDLQTWHWHCKLDFAIAAYHVLEKSS